MKRLLMEGDVDPTAYVCSVNRHRHHLTESQRAEIAARMANMGRTDTLRRGSQSPVGPKEPTAVSTERAASLLNVSPSSVKRAKVVLAKGTPEEIEALKDGKGSGAQAEPLAGIGPSIIALMLLGLNGWPRSLV